MSAESGDAIPVLVFARTPVPGQVKTRLIPAIGAERAANLHRAMLWRTVATAAAAAIGPVSLWCSPAVEHPFIGEMQREFDLDLQLQKGADLGERMHQALRTCTTGAVLVGSDCPFLEMQDLRTAAGSLRGGDDAVVGPAEDGGYYLIGVRQSDMAVFSGIPWGSDKVLSATRQRFRDLAWRWRELATRQDVDRPEDLAVLEDLLIY
ncbi:MAG: TIGR04282 family arsenosugar biosynthesis glycosyltransferase [Gammaproteobacteria bacterium]|nr:TIGR04282 family arsenosugar biosynthesis glycosyltransferase [Gammaproteobacteria bacterium]MDX2458717.1 TIGR04282 family arsenosugar biosynthesis glycosyltransferase [Gammaproteobacteria bacterium]